MKPVLWEHGFNTLFETSQHGREMSSKGSMHYTVYQRYLTLSQTGNDATFHTLTPKCWLLIGCYK